MAITLSARAGAAALAVLLLATVGSATGSEPASAAGPVTRTWTGAGANNSWNNNANWEPAGPNAGDILVFPADAQRKANSNNYPNFTSFSEIRFTGGGYTISGNRVVISGEVSNNAAAGINTVALIIDGDGEVKNSAGTLNLNAANSYLGATTITGGTVHAGHNQAFGEFSAPVDLLAGIVTVGPGLTIFNPILTGGAAVPQVVAAADSAWEGQFAVVGPNEVSVAPGGTFTIKLLAGNSDLWKTGLGTLALTGDNAFFGGEIEARQGTVRITRAEALGNSLQGTRVLDGATLVLDGAGAPPNEVIEFEGEGFAGLGAVRSTQGIVHVANLVATGDARVRVDAGTLRLSNGLDHLPGANFVSKTGGGKFEIEGEGSYNETLVVELGEVAIRGAFAGDMEVAGGVLSGDGTVQGRLDVLSGRVEPGVQGGTSLKVGGVAYLGPQATARFNVASQVLSSWLRVAGTVILDSPVLEVVGAGVAPPGAEVVLIENVSGNPINGFFAGRPEGSDLAVGGNPFRVSYVGGPAPANDVSLTALQGLPPSDTAVDIVPLPLTVAAGAELSVTYLAFNLGDDPVAGAEIRIAIRPGAVFKSNFAPAGWVCLTPPVGQSGNVVCTTNSWAHTGAVEFTHFIVVMTIVGQPGDSLLVDVFLEHDGVEGDPSDNVASVFVDIESPDARPFKRYVPGLARDP